MPIRKQSLVSMPRCYSCTPMSVHGKPGVYFATEGEGPCLRFAAPDFSVPETVWEGPGGTMSMVSLPGTDGEFLAVQKFFRMFQWEEAKLVWVRPPAVAGEPWHVKDLFTLPYLHRFDVLTGADGTRYFVGATLAKAKESKEDWSQPGSIYWAVLPPDLNSPMTLSVLKNELTQNHGYCRGEWNGQQSGFFTSLEGVFAVTPPEKAQGEWQVEQLLICAVSDVALVDVDGCGKQELVTIEGFHGNRFRIWKSANGRFEPVYEHPDTSDFYHVVWGGLVNGKPAVIGGCRRGTQALFMLRCTGVAPLAFESTLIEEGVGPSNVALSPAAHNGTGHDILLSANREVAEAVLYHFE